MAQTEKRSRSVGALSWTNPSPLQFSAMSDENHVVVTGVGDVDQPEGPELHCGAVEPERLPAHGRVPQGVTEEAHRGVGAVTGAEDLDSRRYAAG